MACHSGNFYRRDQSIIGLISEVSSVFTELIHGAGSFFDPNSLARNNAHISPFADPDYQPDLYYYTDAINDHAVRYIKEHQVKNPFFQKNVAHTAPHWPMHALPEDIEKYKGR